MIAPLAALAQDPDIALPQRIDDPALPTAMHRLAESVLAHYQDSDPERRTVFVSTHQISEFEGLIDQFTIIEGGREVLTLEADAARGRFEKPLEEVFISALQGATA